MLLCLPMLLGVLESKLPHMIPRWPSFVLLGALFTLSACGNCKGSAEDADTFVRQAKNQKCDVDEDCVVVISNCSPMKTTFCGQVEMSASAAKSDEWKDIEKGMDACDPECSVCLGALISGCESGYCRAPD